MNYNLKLSLGTATNLNNLTLKSYVMAILQIVTSFLFLFVLKKNMYKMNIIGTNS